MDIGTHTALSPFEMQVMQAIDSAYRNNTNYAGGLTDSDIQVCGTELFGEEWGGAGIPLAAVDADYYPLIGRFLGRLTTKGLVKRSACERAASQNLGYGSWTLTTLGRDMLGLDERQE